jgi:hypothetical protein
MGLGFGSHVNVPPIGLEHQCHQLAGGNRAPGEGLSQVSQVLRCVHDGRDNCLAARARARFRCRHSVSPHLRIGNAARPLPPSNLPTKSPPAGADYNVQVVSFGIVSSTTTRQG